MITSWLRLILIVVAVVLASAGCAHHAKSPTKTDNSASSGFTAVDDGAKQIDAGTTGVEAGPLTDGQRVSVQQIRMGVANVRAGAIVASKAYTVSSKMNEPGAREQRDRVFWCEILGGAVCALGIGLIFGGTTPLLKGFGVILALTGGSFGAYVLILDAVGPSAKFAAMGLAVVSVGAFAWFVIEKFREKRQLKVEQKATKQLTTNIETVRQELTPEAEEKLFGTADPADQGIIGQQQDDETKDLVTAARKEVDPTVASEAPSVSGLLIGTATAPTMLKPPPGATAQQFKQPRVKKKGKRGA